MENKSMGPRNLSFLLSEARGGLSRDIVTIAAGEGVLEPGSVLGEVTASGLYVFSPAAETEGKEGAETASAVLAYRVDATDADAQAVAITNVAEVKAEELLFEATVSTDTAVATKLEQLRAQTIKAR